MYGKFGNFDLGFRFVDPTFTQVIVPKTLIPASFSDYQMVTPVSSSLIHWDSFKLLKDSYPKFDLILGKKTYVSRKNFPDRNVLEEQQIEEYFKSLNYDIVYFENLTILEQVRICQESEKIVCLYGTNLLNCGFCSNKTKVISIKFKIDPLSPTINGFYNLIFAEGGIKHIELEYNGDDLLGYIKEKIR
jgi:capsular polysaccharide biosynthesis protein